MRSVRAGDFELVHLSDQDLDRMADLVDAYRDLKLGAADASVIAIATTSKTWRHSTIATSPS